ncbi:MAG: hypothetical protein GF355_03685 [Candidatus Eisenbacteria bacterium]|nr:hypothetical protein [Candidatus Eisenbacteria bacterium]
MLRSRRPPPELRQSSTGGRRPVERTGGQTTARMTDYGWAVAILLVVWGAGFAGVWDYGLTWDEPTYFRYARLQREWIGDVAAAVLHPQRFSPLFDRETIASVWLQHPERNGHPPFTEVWMAVAGWPWRAAGLHDTIAFRIAMLLLLGSTGAVLFLLIRRWMSRAAALTGSLAFLGVPAIWAHGHIGATEIPQCFFWALLALLTPAALHGRRRWILVWAAAAALSFATKFTNLLIIAWVLGAAGILGAYRSRRWWLLGVLGFGVAPLLLVLIDPFFWPWQGGWERFVDYLRQVTSRAEWVALGVYYLGTDYGFYPPWHYRIVQVLARLPVTTLLLFLPGLALCVPALWRQIRRQRMDNWPAALAVTGVAGTLLVGILPNSPNHDGARQFVYVFVAVGLACAVAAEAWRRLWRKRAADVRDWRRGALRNGAPACALASLVIAVAWEPWGLAYHSEWLGGARGAWRQGFEVSYWGEAVTPDMLRAVTKLEKEPDEVRRILSVPKLNYFYDAQDFLDPLAGEAAPLEAKSVVPAFMQPWLPDWKKNRHAALMTLTLREPAAGILIFYRRAMDTGILWNALERLQQRGSVELVAETRVQTVPLARLYRVKRMETVTLVEDPAGWTWHRPEFAASALR